MRWELPKFLRRRSLSAAVLTTIFSVLQAGLVVGVKHGGMSRTDWLAEFGLFSLGISLVTLSTWNLIQDVERGYSPQRCSLAAMLLFLAAFPPVFLGIELLRYFL